jgi:hypothetical protein
MKEDEKFAALKVEVTLAGQFQATLKVLEPPTMPIKVGDGRITLAVPMVGSLTIAHIGE